MHKFNYYILELFIFTPAIFVMLVIQMETKTKVITVNVCKVRDCGCYLRPQRVKGSLISNHTCCYMGPQGLRFRLKNRQHSVPFNYKQGIIQPRNCDLNIKCYKQTTNKKPKAKGIKLSCFSKALYS